MSSSKSPCAACKFLRRKCTQECVFAPYFPPDQPQKFAKVHKVFGASNVTKLLNELNVNQREDAVNSLEYEAETRLRDPVYGCVGLISILQHRLKQVQHDLFNAKKELANYIGQSAMLPILQHPGLMHQPPYNMQPMMGIPPGGGEMVHQHQQVVEAQQMAAIMAGREQPEILRTYDFNGGFDNGPGQVVNSGNGGGFNQMSGGVSMSASLALSGSYDNGGGYGQIQQQQQQVPQDNSQIQLQLQPQILIHHQQQQQQQVVAREPCRDGSEDGGPAC